MARKKETGNQEDAVRIPEIPAVLSASDCILRGRAAQEARTAYLEALLTRLEQAHQRAILELRADQAEAFTRNAIAVEVLRELRNTMLADISSGQRIQKRLGEEG